MEVFKESKVRKGWKCRLGFHSNVELPKPANRIARVFFVRKIVGCNKCGAVYTTRFDNGLAGGGTAFCGYVDPAELTVTKGGVS